MDEGLQIFCSHCKSPLGLPEKDLLVKGSVISTSKVHLMSLQRKTSEPLALKPSSGDVLVSDTSTVHPHVLTSQVSASGQEDGFLFNSGFCPFCVHSDNCIGVHVVATNGSNIQFQNKILFYLVISWISRSLKQRLRKLEQQTRFCLHTTVQAWWKIRVPMSLRNLHTLHQFKILEAGGTQKMLSK